jgi:cytochrome P450
MPCAHSGLPVLNFDRPTSPGPYVRICPNQVSISDLQSVKEIHKIGTGFLKTDFYQRLTHHESDCLTSFAMRDPKQHIQRRKLLASPMSKNGLSQWEDLIHEKLQMAIDGIKRSATVDGKANILAWFTFMVNHNVFAGRVPGEEH